MSDEKKNEVTEEVKEEARELTPDELAKINGGGFIPGPKPGQGSSETKRGASLAAGAGLAMYLEKIPEAR